MHMLSTGFHIGNALRIEDLENSNGVFNVTHMFISPLLRCCANTPTPLVSESVADIQQLLKEKNQHRKKPA